MRKLLLTVVLTVAAVWCSAAPVWRAAVTVVQPWGDTLHCLASGDEFYAWLHDAEGFTIVQHPATGAYVYACSDPRQVMTDKGGARGGLPEGLGATGLVPGVDDPQLAGLKRGLMPTQRYLSAAHRAWAVPETCVPAAPKDGSAITGVLNNVVIFIRFADESVCTTSPFSTIDGMFNDAEAGHSSLYNYFHKSSYGRLSVWSHYLPEAAADGTVLSYQDVHARNYFMPYNAVTNPSGYANDSARRSREFQLLQDAVAWVNTNCAVDSLPNVDADNDGLVDNVCFVVSGSYTGWSDLLWPHKWQLYDRTVNLGTKRIFTYNLQLAGSGESYFNVSTLCHEMTHTLGAPDIYHYDNYTSVSPGGSWDLMNSNATPPQQTNSLFKLHFTGWLDSIPQIVDTGVYTLQSLGSGPNHAVKIASAVPHEWYILEYRNTSDTFDQSIPNRGLLVWRYNDRPIADNADFDFYNTPHQLWLFRPGSSIDTVQGTISQASFGVNGRTAFGPSTNPHPYLCNGMADTTFSLTNIHLTGSNNESVTFTFTPRGAGACGTVGSFPVAQGFESGDVDCWTTVARSTSNEERLGVMEGTASAPSHAGYYHFRFSSYNRATDYNQYLISPRLQHSHPLQLSFWLRRSNNYTENVRVVCSRSTSTPEAFTDTVTEIAVTTAGWQQRTVTIPADARYVALNYYSEYQYYLYIDDLLLRDTVGPDTVVRDTVYIYAHDTLTRVLHDTLSVWVHDTLSRVNVDTLYVHVVDTLLRGVTDTLERTVLDTMLYQPPLYEVAIVANESRRGQTSGSGFFLQGTRLEIAALPYPGYRFEKWMDGNHDNPRTITVESDMLMNAHFVPIDAARESKTIVHVTDTIVLRDTVWLTVRDTVTLTLHDTTYITSVDTLRVVLRDTVWIPTDQRDTFWIVVHEPFLYDTTTYLPLTVRADNPTMGTAAGNGMFPAGTLVQLGALPQEGFHFVQWSDGATENPHTFLIMVPTTITAIFAPGSEEGIADADTAAATSVYALDGRVVVEAPATLPVTVYNVLGQQVYQHPADQGTAQRRCVSGRLHRGLYVVRIGALPATKLIIE